MSVFPKGIEDISPLAQLASFTTQFDWDDDNNKYLHPRVLCGSSMSTMTKLSAGAADLWLEKGYLVHFKVQSNLVKVRGKEPVRVIFLVLPRATDSQLDIVELQKVGFMCVILPIKNLTLVKLTRLPRECRTKMYLICIHIHLYYSVCFFLSVLVHFIKWPI